MQDLVFHRTPFAPKCFPSLTMICEAFWNIGQRFGTKKYDRKIRNLGSKPITKKLL